MKKSFTFRRTRSRLTVFHQLFPPLQSRQLLPLFVVGPDSRNAKPCKLLSPIQPKFDPD